MLDDGEAAVFSGLDDPRVDARRDGEAERTSDARLPQDVHGSGHCRRVVLEVTTEGDGLVRRALGDALDSRFGVAVEHGRILA